LTLGNPGQSDHSGEGHNSNELEKTNIHSHWVLFFS